MAKGVNIISISTLTKIRRKESGKVLDLGVINTNRSLSYGSMRILTKALSSMDMISPMASDHLSSPAPPNSTSPKWKYGD